MVGKWHLCPTDEMNLAATRRNWPSGRGFERWYGFLGAETNQWYPDLVYDNHPVDQPRTPEEGYHLTDDLTDKALEFIKDAKAIAPEKPFFLYYAPGACHAPHHAPKEWIDKFKGQFDMGYEAMREQTLARQKELGIVPADTELPPINPIGTPETRTGPDGQPFPSSTTRAPGTRSNDEEKRLFARMAEVYAGFLAHADHHIGRLLDYLEQTEQLENTLIVLVSDNGASGEGGPNGSVNEMKFANGVADDLAAEPGQDRRPRRHEDLQPLPERLGDGVQHAVQDVEALRVQRRHRPTRASSPGRPASRRAARSATSTTTRSTSCRRSWTCSASRRPRRSRATPRAVRRRQHARQLRRRGGPVGPRRRSSTRCSARARSGTRAGRPSRPTRRSPAGATSTTTSGSSTTPTSTARSCTTSPRSSPTSCASWSTSGSPRPARTARSRSTTARRSRSSPRRGRSSPRRGTATSTSRAPRRCREWQAVNTRNRSFVIGALVDIPAPGAEGVLFAHRRPLRRPRALRQGQPAALREQLRRQPRSRWSSAPRTSRPATNLILSASFEKDGHGARRTPPGCSRSTTATRRSARARSRPSSAPSRSPDRGSTSAGTPASRSPTTTPARRPTRSPAARSTGSRSTSAVSPTSTSSARPPMLIAQ